ncbi:hypothetical protein C1M53_26370 [Mesorhizobium sp. Pch-S]|nr:hypothetical protein C1M53_26370 [Mesorhizobium sp. Pch-S]
MRPVILTGQLAKLVAVDFKSRHHFAVPGHHAALAVRRSAMSANASLKAASKVAPLPCAQRPSQCRKTEQYLCFLRLIDTET